MKSGLLSSIDAVFEHNRREDQKKIQKLKTQREAELAHSNYLKNTSSPHDLKDARFVVQQWANKHSSRKLSTISQDIASKRRNRTKPYSRPDLNRGPQPISKINSRFGKVLCSTIQTSNEPVKSNITSTFSKPKSLEGFHERSSKTFKKAASTEFCTDTRISPSPLNMDHSLIELSDEESIINISDTTIEDGSNLYFVETNGSHSNITDINKNECVGKNSDLFNGICSNVMDSHAYGLKDFLDQNNSANDEEKTVYFDCPILNCNCKFKLKEDFQSHMDKFEHSPNNPWFEFCSEKESKTAMCPECCKIFQDINACRQHMTACQHDIPVPPLPVMGYLCAQCLCVFPSQQDCNSHIQELKHYQQTFPFEDDFKHKDKNSIKGIPVSKKFFEDYYLKCMQSDFHVVCCECELQINKPEQLKQHLDETNHSHHCMALTEIAKIDIFASYFCTHVCGKCHAAVNNPTLNGGYHNCSNDIAGKVVVDGCKSFRNLVIGLCIRLEQDQIREIKITNSQHEPMDVDTEVNQIKAKKSRKRAKKSKMDCNEAPKQDEPGPSSSKGVPKYDEPGPSKKMSQLDQQYNYVEQSTVSANTLDSILKKQVSKEHLPESHDLINPEYLKTMANIIFLDVDNWKNFFQKLPNRLPERTFVWGFYGGKTQWKEPFQCGPYRYQVDKKRFHLHDRCGTTKDAADFAICLTIGKMDMCLPSNVHFTILSGDKGFCEIERQMRSSKRKAVVIDPHEATQMSDYLLYTMIISVGET